MSYQASYVRNISFKSIEEIFPDLFDLILKNSQQGFLQLEYQIPPEKEKFKETLNKRLQTLGFHLSFVKGKILIQW